MAKDQSSSNRNLRAGGVQALMGVTGGPLNAAFHGLDGYFGQELGDQILGVPTHHSFGKEAGRGALGGGIYGSINGSLRGLVEAYGAPSLKLNVSGQEIPLSRSNVIKLLLKHAAIGGLKSAGLGGLGSGIANSEY